MRRHVARALLPGLALVLAASLTGCTGDDDSPFGDRSPDEVLAQAADQLASTSGTNMTLSTDDFPDGTSGIVGASGATTSAPAFEGTLQVRLASTTFDVPVVAVDDVVWARLPLQTKWSDIDPAEYGAPDPSQLLGEENGVGALLASTEDAEQGASERGGKDNKEVLTTFSGTIDGDVMERMIPSSAGDTFDVDYLVTEENQLREVRMTGVFYAGTDEMTYTLRVDDYGLEKTVTAP